VKELDELRAEFEALKKSEEFCVDGSCKSDEEIDLKDYPSYTEALYAQIIAPSVSGVYISRWDIKEIADIAGDSMAIHPRKRMFELLMKYAVTQERMEAVLDAMEENIQKKINIYEELKETFPHSKNIFDKKIAKAKKSIEFFSNSF
jgi:DNA topoisomerase IA